MASQYQTSKSILSLSELESFCHRMGMSLQSGIPLREAWESEADLVRGRKRSVFDRVAEKLREGEHTAEALASTGAFPALLVEMVRVGEETGNLDQVFFKLADHYRNLIRTRRTFYQGITWPVLQAIAGVLVITLFLLALDYLQRRVPVLVAYDLFQLGLTPLQNLAVLWCGVLVVVAIPLWLAWSIRRGRLGGAIGRAATMLPLVGKIWRRMATSRFAWAFGAAIDAGMDAVSATRLALSGSSYGAFRRREAEIVRSIERGNSFESSLRQTGAFPAELLRAIAIGERTGRITESVQRLSEDYEEQSAMSLRRLGQISGLVVSMSVVGLIGFSILAMYAGYMSTVSEALNANTKTLAEIRQATASTGATAANGEASPESDNSIIQTRDAMVKDFVENNESFKQIESIYTQLGRFGKVSNQEFLDGLVGESPAEKRYREMKERMQREREQNAEAGNQAE